MIYEHNLLNAIQNNDEAECLLAQLDYMRITGAIEPLVKNVKNEDASNNLRMEGNAAFGSGDNQKALVLYNKALLYAPKNSRPMKLAYGNRSALWLKSKCFTNCVKDINTCLAMGCPSELHVKLAKRKEEASRCVAAENFCKQSGLTINYKEFFELKTLNAEIPNASSDIKIIIEPEGPKIVATRDIEVGTVLAKETPFVSCLDKQNSYVTCYYCQKMSCNLIPCDGCCVALFCDESCMQKSMNEDHGVLCSIIEILHMIDFQCILAMKAVVKMRQSATSWKDFMSASCNIFESTPENYIKNIFVDRQLWIQHDDEKTYFITGKMFAFSHNLATVMHYLDKNTDFFPHKAREEPMRVVSKMLMILCLHAYPSIGASSVCNKTTGTLCYHFPCNFSLYSFIGTLKQTCLANVKAEMVGRDATLLTVMPIKEGTELTISHIGHWLGENYSKYTRPRRMFFLQNRICMCLICSGDGFANVPKLTDCERKIFNEFCTFFNSMTPLSPYNLAIVYKKTCIALHKLSDAPYSSEYRILYTHFTHFITRILNGSFRNVVL